MANGCQRNEKKRSGSIVSIQMVNVTCAYLGCVMLPLTSAPGLNGVASDTPNQVLNCLTSVSARHTRERGASSMTSFSMRSVDDVVVDMRVHSSLEESLS